MNNRFKLFFLRRINLIVLFFLIFSAAYNQSSWIRVNQVGYLIDDVKVAVWISKGNEIMSAFQIIAPATREVLFTGSETDIRQTGRQHAFESSARLYFTALKKPGSYILKAGDTESMPFRIGNDIYVGAAEIPLQYLPKRFVSGARCHFGGRSRRQTQWVVF